jgi:hypothetical protein
MAIDIATPGMPLVTSDGRADYQRRGIGRWSALAFPLLVAAGAATVVAGSYATWATFYAGLIARNGVDGHGKYFIGLAAASMLAALLSTRRGVSRSLSLMIIPAGLTIAGMALRDIRNFDRFVHDPASGFYVPAMGNGQYIVLAGAMLLVVAAFAQTRLPSLRPFDVRRTLAAAAAVAGVALLVPGLYGEYYEHLSTAHMHGHANIFTSPHFVTAAGVIALFAALRFTIAAIPRTSGRSRAR